MTFPHMQDTQCYVIVSNMRLEIDASVGDRKCGQLDSFSET